MFFTRTTCYFCRLRPRLRTTPTLPRLLLYFWGKISGLRTKDLIAPAGLRQGIVSAVRLQISTLLLFPLPRLLLYERFYQVRTRKCQAFVLLSTWRATVLSVARGVHSCYVTLGPMALLYAISSLWRIKLHPVTHKFSNTFSQNAWRFSKPNFIRMPIQRLRNHSVIQNHSWTLDNYLDDQNVSQLNETLEIHAWVIST